MSTLIGVFIFQFGKASSFRSVTDRALVCHSVSSRRWTGVGAGAWMCLNSTRWYEPGLASCTGAPLVAARKGSETRGCDPTAIARLPRPLHKTRRLQATHHGCAACPAYGSHSACHSSGRKTGGRLAADLIDVTIASLLQRPLVSFKGARGWRPARPFGDTACARCSTYAYPLIGIACQFLRKIF